MVREKQRKQKKRNWILYSFLVLVLLISLTVLIAVKVFTVEKVEVEGNEWYDSIQIEKIILNDQYSWNSLYVFLKYRFVDIGQIPFVDTMEVSLDDPHTVRIKVYEKGILGYLYIPILGQNAYFDKDGFVIETSVDVIPNVPKVTGIDCNEVVLYEKLSIEDGSILKFLLNLTQILKKYELEPDEIAFDAQKGASLYYGDIQVVIGEEAYLSQKIIHLSAILQKIEEMGLQAGTLHLENWTEENGDIVFDKE